MAESSGEKTEQPTGKKLEDARKEGNVPQSKEVTIAITMVVSFYAFKFLYSLISSQVTEVMTDQLHRIGTMERLDGNDLQDMFIWLGIKYGICAFPLLLIVGFAGSIITLAQTKLLVNFKSLKPKFDRMNPLQGIKRLFSLKGFVEVLKSVLKIALLICIIYICIAGQLSNLPKLIDSSIEDVAVFTGNVISDIINKVLIAFAAVAVGDYMYQRFQYFKNLRMTKQEVKEEYKNIEGDPQIKGRIKQKQREISQRRMMADVPTADVVIKNPTHFAVALKYDRENANAPVVVAKGQDNIAFKIIKIAEENEVAVVENVPLARALYASVEVGMEIPKEFYNPVAEILAHIYSKDESESAQRVNAV